MPGAAYIVSAMSADQRADAPIDHGRDGQGLGMQSEVGVVQNRQ
jgi:hypothetical protein